MAKAKAIYIWEHFVDGVKVGEIRRYPAEGAKKKNDYPYYIPRGNHWASGAPAKPWPLFGLDSIRDINRPVIICEGQKVATAFHGLGYQAVSIIQGASSFRQMNWEPLRGCKYIWYAPDQDKPGEECMSGTWEIVSQLAPVEQKVIRLPDLKEKDDLCDWLKRQPELEDWNELDPLERHPARNILQARLEETISKNLDDVKWSRNDEWKSPLPVDTKLRPVHRMNAEFLPRPIRDWMVDCQKRIGCPLEYLAISAIAVAAAAIGTGCTIRPKELAPWPVVPNDFAAIIGPPSTKKSAAIQAALDPLEQIDNERFISFQEEQSEYDKEKFIFDQKMSALKERGKSAVKSPTSNKRGEQIDDVVEELESPPQQPALTRSIVKDATKEAITPILESNPRGIIITLDELVQLIAGWDKEGRQGERQFFLQAWNGNQGYTVDRASYAKGQRIPRLCISILGGMQPDTFKTYLIELSENSNDGMIQRFQLMIYLDHEDGLECEEIDKLEDKAAKFEYYRCIKNLATYDWGNHGATVEPQELPYFKFSKTPEMEIIDGQEDWDSAQELWNQWRAALTQKIKREENNMVEQHLSKYPSLMPSLALVFHCMGIATGEIPGPINRATTQMAIDWCEFLEEHARRVYEISKPQEIALANSLADSIQKGVLGSQFTVRDALRKCGAQLKKSSDIMNACQQLSDLNWLRQRTIHPPTGGRPKIEFVVNPGIIDDSTL